MVWGMVERIVGQCIDQRCDESSHDWFHDGALVVRAPNTLVKSTDRTHTHFFISCCSAFPPLFPVVGRYGTTVTDTSLDQIEQRTAYNPAEHQVVLEKTKEQLHQEWAAQTKQLTEVYKAAQHHHVDAMTVAKTAQLVSAEARRQRFLSQENQAMQRMACVLSQGWNVSKHSLKKSLMSGKSKIQKRSMWITRSSGGTISKNSR